MIRTRKILMMAFLTFFASMSFMSKDKTDSLAKIEKKQALDTNELYLFKEGKWHSSLGAVSYHGTSKFIPYSEFWQVGGNMHDNVTFANAFNMNEWTTIHVKMEQETYSGQFGMFAYSSIGCYDGCAKPFTDDNGSFVAKIEDYKGQATQTCSYWKSEHSNKADHTLDLGKISGFYFGGSEGKYKVSEIKVCGKIGAEEPEVEYHATIVSEHGTVTLSSDSFKAGDSVTVQITPEEGYEVDTIEVKDSQGNLIEVKDGQFVAVESDVTITVTYKKIADDKKPEEDKTSENRPSTDKTTEENNTTTDKDDKTTNKGDKTTEENNTTKKGCSGSIIAASSLISAFGLVSIGFVLKKKKQD